MLAFDTFGQEVDAVVRFAKHAIALHTPSSRDLDNGMKDNRPHVAVLFRSKGIMSQFAEALERAGLTTLVVGRSALLERPAVQDVWMLLSGERHEQQAQLGALLDGYEQLREFDRRELALIEPLRTLRLVHYSAWVARRWDDPAFPAAFPDFGTPDYWRGQADTLVEQLEAMQAPPLVA